MPNVHETDAGPLPRPEFKPHLEPKVYVVSCSSTIGNGFPFAQLSEACRRTGRTARFVESSDNPRDGAYNVNCNVFGPGRHAMGVASRRPDLHRARIAAAARALEMLYDDERDNPDPCLRAIFEPFRTEEEKR